jgi:hypothetical protein
MDDGSVTPRKMSEGKLCGRDAKKLYGLQGGKDWHRAGKCREDIRRHNEELQQYKTK